MTTQAEVKRAGTLRLLVCRVCGTEFTRRKAQPVCSNACNLIYKQSKHNAQNNPSTTADLQGAKSHDRTNQNS